MDPLQEILDTEQDIARQVAAERSKAAAWLEQTKQAIAASEETEIAREQARAAREEQAARDAVLERAAAIVDAARALAARLQALDDDRLRSLVWTRLAAIVPGRSRDREDVEDRSDRPEGAAPARPRDDSAV